LPVEPRQCEEVRILTVASARSVCPSFCRWNAVLRLHDILSASDTCFQKSEVNKVPQSDTMLLGSPWGLTICRRKWSAKSFGFIVPWHAMKCPIFVSQSITTHSASFPLLVGSAVMKSIDIASHGRWGNFSGLSNLNGACRIGLMR